MSSVGAFDDIALTYDNAIDWKLRLEKEMPFILDTLGNPRDKRVLDLACGTGRHSITLASRGASVIGIDVSEAMLERSRELAKEIERQPVFIQADMLSMADVTSDEFDLVLCLGNSLSLVGSFEEQRTLLGLIHDHLAENGVFVGQVLNFEEIRTSMFRFFPLKTGTTEDGNLVVFLRFFDHHSNDTSDLFFVTSMFAEGSWQSRTSQQQVLNLSEEKLRKLLSSAGFSNIEIFAGYNKAVFRPLESRNILVRACK